MKKVFKLTVFCVSVVLLQGCSSLGTYNPATERNEFIFISTPEEVNMGKAFHQKLAEEFKFSNDPIKKQRLNRIGKRIAHVSDRQDYTYNFYLIEKNEFNAFTTPGGNIYFFEGLMDALETDDRIAYVLAHEVGHCAAKHTIKKFQAALGYNLVANIIFSQLELGEGTQDIVNMSSEAAVKLVFSAYSREDEYQADKLGLRYMDRAGYDLNAAVEVFEVLKQESKSPNVPLILRTHPHLDDRIEQVKEEIEIISISKKSR